MTQPPLSQGIQRLETLLGSRLFDRDASGVRITATGAALLPLADEVVRLADALVDEARTWSVKPVLRMGVAADVEGAGAPLIAAVRDIDEVIPALGGSVELTERVRSGELDIAVVRHPGVVDGLAAGPVHILATSFLAPQGEEGLAATTLPVAVPPRRWQPPAHDQFIDALRRLGHSGRVVEEADAAGRHALVAAGRAVALTVCEDATTRQGTAPVLPLRVRVVQPMVEDRQRGLDHDAAAAALEAALTSAGVDA